MSTSDPPIIITGGSVSIEFNESDFQSNGNGRRSNTNKKIKRIEVTGDNINIAENIPNGKVTIKIYYGNP
jgi:hypothetical protein